MGPPHPLPAAGPLEGNLSLHLGLRDDIFPPLLLLAHDALGFLEGVGGGGGGWDGERRSRSRDERHDGGRGQAEKEGSRRERDTHVTPPCAKWRSGGLAQRVCAVSCKRNRILTRV